MKSQQQLRALPRAPSVPRTESQRAACWVAQRSVANRLQQRRVGLERGGLCAPRVRRTTAGAGESSGDLTTGPRGGRTPPWSLSVSRVGELCVL